MKLSKEIVLPILYRLTAETIGTGRFRAREITPEYDATLTRTTEDKCLRLYIVTARGMKVFYTFTSEGKLIHKMRG